MRVAGELQAAGYRPLMDSLERSPHLWRHVPTTSRSLRVERERLEAILGAWRRDGASRHEEDGGFRAAIREFTRSREWRPAGAGWFIPNPVKLTGGGTIVLGILLVQRDDGTLVGGRELHAVGSVTVCPKGRAPRAAIGRVTPTILAAGYRGGPQRARSTKTGRPAWLFGDFWKNRLGPGSIAAERKRLEDLAVALRGV
jgi:hypothetical protein